jgi:hypothetical protein
MSPWSPPQVASLGALLLLSSCGGRSGLWGDAYLDENSATEGAGAERASSGGGATFNPGGEPHTGGGDTDGAKSSGGAVGEGGLGSGGSLANGGACVGADEDGDGVANLCDECPGFDDRTPRVVEGDLVLTTQAELNELAGVVELKGSLTTGFNSLALTSLTPLSCLQHVSGSLNLEMTGISQVDALHSLSTVGGSLKLSDNNLLENLAGLEALSGVGGDLIISLNDALTAIDGFGSLIVVGGALSIDNLNGLQNIRGFSSLASASSVHLYNNPSLKELDGFVALETVDKRLVVGSNSSLTVIEGFDALEYTRELNISYNESLVETAGFHSLTRVGLWSITYNDVLEELGGFSALKSVEADLRLSDNPHLEAADSFEALEQISGELAVLDNDSLKTLGFPSLTSVGAGLAIAFNGLIEGGGRVRLADPGR